MCIPHSLRSRATAVQTDDDLYSRSCLGRERDICHRSEQGAHCRSETTRSAPQRYGFAAAASRASLALRFREQAAAGSGATQCDRRLRPTGRGSSTPFLAKRTQFKVDASRLRNPPTSRGTGTPPGNRARRGPYLLVCSQAQLDLLVTNQGPRASETVSAVSDPHQYPSLPGENSRKPAPLRRL